VGQHGVLGVLDGNDHGGGTASLGDDDALARLDVLDHLGGCVLELLDADLCHPPKSSYLGGYFQRTNEIRLEWTKSIKSGRGTRPDDTAATSCLAARCYSRDRWRCFPLGFGSLYVPERRVDQLPAFRFRVDGSRLIVVPVGFIGGHGLLYALEEPWSGAIGDIFVSDDDRAVVQFARSTASSRGAAERRLEEWSKADHWEIVVESGTLPLADIADSTPRIGTAPPKCSRCGAGSPKERETKAFLERGFFHTRCLSCNARIEVYGLQRCERCGDVRGWMIESFAGDIEHPTASCLCQGVLCRSCGINMARRPTSNYYREEDRTAWHIPHFVPPICDEGRRIKHHE
jgi:hypothetical protein